MNRYSIQLLKWMRLYKRKILRPKILKNYGVRINDGEHISKNIRYYLYSGAYEEDEIRILNEKLSSTDKVLEIGSGLGFLTSYCAKKIGEGNIIGYEANPLLIEKIKDNFHLNNVNPNIRNAILGETNSEVDFFIEDSFWSSSTIKRSNGAKVVKIPTENINKVLSNFMPNFLIMDIEGGEKELIYLINFDPINKILIEIHPHVVGNDEATKIIGYLSKKGFEIDFSISKNMVYYFKRTWMTGR